MCLLTFEAKDCASASAVPALVLSPTFGGLSASASDFEAGGPGPASSVWEKTTTGAIAVAVGLGLTARRTTVLVGTTGGRGPRSSIHCFAAGRAKHRLAKLAACLVGRRHGALGGGSASSSERAGYCAPYLNPFLIVLRTLLLAPSSASAAAASSSSTVRASTHPAATMVPSRVAARSAALLRPLLGAIAASSSARPRRAASAYAHSRGPTSSAVPALFVARPHRAPSPLPALSSLAAGAVGASTSLSNQSGESAIGRLFSHR